MSMDWRDDLHFIAWKAICERREGRHMTEEELRLIQKERSVYRDPKYIDRYVKLHDPFREGDLELQIAESEYEYDIQYGLGLGTLYLWTKGRVGGLEPLELRSFPDKCKKFFHYTDFARAGEVGHENFYRHELYRWRFKKYCEQNYNYNFNQVEQHFIEGSFRGQTSRPALDITLWDPKETKLKYYMQIRWEHAKLENKMSLGENTYLFHFDDKRLGKQWHSGYHFDKGTFGPEWREYCNLRYGPTSNSFRIRQTFPRYCNMYVPESIWRVWRHSNFFYQPDSDTEEMYCDE